MSTRRLGVCPKCGRDVKTLDYRYIQHSSTGEVGFPCSLSGMREPLVGDSAAAYLSRAVLVGDLACRLKDEDPSQTWDYLTSLSGSELQKMTMIALAAVPVDKPISEIYGWVCALPVAEGAA